MVLSSHNEAVSSTIRLIPSLLNSIRLGILQEISMPKTVKGIHSGSNDSVTVLNTYAGLYKADTSWGNHKRSFHFVMAYTATVNLYIF
jgi:hypothetical protein